MKNGKSCYVEIDAYAAAWLENLVSRGVIAPGDVMCRSVTDIRPEELASYSQVHLYAGIGVHSYALRRAGISDTANIWTFSEPCQPFSDAGKGLGFADQRYLRPYTHHLIEQCRPAICLGEQVASNDGLGWLDIVQSDFERARYACGAQDTCSAGVGAPHIRQRLRICAVAEEWLADMRGDRRNIERRVMGIETSAGSGRDQSNHGGFIDVLVHKPQRYGAIGHNSGAGRPGPTNGFWSNADWLYCRDGKWRPVEPGTFPLAHGNSFKLGSGSAFEGKSRVGMLRAYGNAIDAEATTAFYRQVGEVLGLIR